MMMGRGLFTWVLAIGLLAAPQLFASGADQAPPTGERSIAVTDWMSGPVTGAQLSTDQGDWVASEPIPAGDAVLVGAQWPPDARVRVQIRAATEGSWDEWHELVMSAGEGPDLDSDEATGANWAASEPVWVGRVSHLQVRVSGDGPEPDVTIRTVDIGGDDDLTFEPAEMKPDRGDTAAASSTRPTIVPRSSWDPNDDCPPRSSPSYADRAEYAVVHHTAGSNNYTSSQSANIVRSVCLYHRNTLGWKHIGYNLVVDKYGYIFEGRDGGVDRPVIGAHAAGFNTGSIGVSALGCFDSSCSGDTTIYRSMLNAVDEVLAWKFHIHGIDPHGTTTVTSGGSNKYPSGTTVTLDNIIGHRDVGNTACPGDRYYNYVAGGIESMADRVAARMPEQFLRRIAGANRIETAVRLSRWGFTGTSGEIADRVVIASSEAFPDGLAAGPLAGSFGGPVLLTPSTHLPGTVADEIRRLGATRATLVGGTARLSAQVEADLTSKAGIAPDRIERYDGADRFQTARRVAWRVINREQPRAAIVALGRHERESAAFPDALAASALGAMYGLPILLVEPDRLPSDTAWVLENHDWPDGIYVVGGTAAISEGVAAQAAVAARTTKIRRLAGDDRYSTSAAVADEWMRLGGRTPRRTIFATGRDWPDALAAGPATVRRGAAFILVDPRDLDRSPASRDWVAEHASVIDDGRVVGASQAVSDHVSTQLARLIE